MQHPYIIRRNDRIVANRIVSSQLIDSSATNLVNTFDKYLGAKYGGSVQGIEMDYMKDDKGFLYLIAVRSLKMKN